MEFLYVKKGELRKDGRVNAYPIERKGASIARAMINAETKHGEGGELFIQITPSKKQTMEYKKKYLGTLQAERSRRKIKMR